MDRRTFLIAAAALAGLAALPRGACAAPHPPTDADRADFGRIETYLNGIRSLKAQFIQVGPDGGTSRGTAWMVRPGRMRFQYDPPSPLLLVAGHGLVVFHDAKLKQTSNIPLDRTPLGILLADRISLSGDVTVSAIDRAPGGIQVTLHRTQSPGEGSLTLNFSDAPLALRQWVVTDAQRAQTRVTLYDVQTGGSFDESLFTFVDPNFFGGNRSNPGGGG